MFPHSPSKVGCPPDIQGSIRFACEKIDKIHGCGLKNGSRPSPGWEGKGLTLFQPRRGRELARLQKFWVEELRLVAGAGIGEDRDDRVPGPELARQPDRAADIDPGRAAEDQPLFLHEV